MKYITIKEYEKLPLNDPIKMEVGQKFLLRPSGIRETNIGDVITIFEIERLTERGYESKMVIYTVVK
jgi:hypothetical protein